ncbi:hypothetical protein [Hymenobacter ruber]
MNQHNSRLKRGTKPLQRHSRLAPVSATHRAGRVEQARVYKAVDAAESPWCLACGSPGPLDHSHCLTQKQWPAHKLNPANIHLECRRCHEMWENNKHAYARQYPLAWAAKMAVMRRLEPSYYAAFRMKNPTLPT